MRCIQLSSCLEWLFRVRPRVCVTLLCGTVLQTYNHSIKRWEHECKFPSLIALTGPEWELEFKSSTHQEGAWPTRKQCIFPPGSLSIKWLTQSRKGTDSNTHADYFILRTFKLLSQTTHIPNISARSKATFSPLSHTQSHISTSSSYQTSWSLLSDSLFSKNYLGLLPSSYTKTCSETSNIQIAMGWFSSWAACDRHSLEVIFQ